MLAFKLTKIVLILVTLLISLGQGRISFAAASHILSFNQIDLDSDGKPDKAIIQCACVTTRDQILVFDGAGDMLSSENWSEGTDFANDTWVFDIGARGEANLIIQFRSSDRGQVARLYDDVDGDGVVAYRIEEKTVIVEESPFWSLEVRARDGWFTQNGQVALNIYVLLDKPVPARFEFIDEKLARQYMPHDGRPDVEFKLVDDDHDGVAEYFLSNIVSPVPEQFEIGRARLWFNAGKKISHRPESALFWPFLNLEPLSATSNSSLKFFDLLPGVSMDWQRSTILGFVLPGYPVETGYWINSQNSIQAGQVNDSSFETPHAWYDLAGDQDGLPELNVRLFMPIGEEWQEIRYSWNQVNSGNLVWDYKLGLMGDYPIDEIVDLNDFSLRMIPYEELPSWVISREWKLTTFVAREGEPRESSEGIYAWTPWSGADPTSPDNPNVEAHDAAMSFVTGASITPPYEYFGDIWEGFRGEYNLAHPLKPMLYFSPLDHRLHLKGGEHGLLNLGNGRYVTYDDLDDNDYLDQWITLAAGEIQRQLYVSNPYLLYAGENRVLLKKVYLADSLFETLPPQNHEEWQELGLKIEKHKHEFAPDDFEGMVRQFEAPETHIEEATLEDFRHTSDGFRFVLELQPGFSISGPEALDWNRLTPGAYVVTYNRSISIKPLTPPVPQAALVDVKITQLEPSTIQVALRNNGLEDLPQATLELWATPPDGNTSVVVTQTVQLLAQESTSALLSWAPISAGTWTLTPVIRQADGSMFSGKSMQVSVLQAADSANLIPLSVSAKLVPFIVIGLISFAGLASMAFFRAWKRSTS